MPVAPAFYPGKLAICRATSRTFVKMANACWGVPDIFVVAEVATAGELDKLVIDKIQLIEGVERTETHIAIE